MINYNELFGLMIERRATHFHLVPGSPVMMRAQGIFAPIDNYVLSPQDTRNFMESILLDEQKRDFELRKELNISYSVPGLSRFRLNLFRQRGSVAAVITTNPPSPPTMEELGLPEVLKSLATNARSGLIAVCGPKQCGKSHTMAALVNYILEIRTCQVISLENPIDFLHKNKKGIICQREMGSDTLTYENAFQSLMFQGCDVLVLGEINSYEIVSNALEMAAGGSLVLAQSMSPNALSFLEKLIDLYPPHLSQSARNLLAVGLEAVVSQVLVTKTSGGLMPIFEILTGIPQVRSIIREGKLFQLHSVMAAAGREFGMITQEHSLRSAVKKNFITAKEAEQKASRAEEFKKLMSLPY
jgi:twitching motility protein PilT